MLHINSKFLQVLSQASRWFVVLLLTALAGSFAPAQTLSLAPWQVSAVTSLAGTTAADYAGPASGLTLNAGQALASDAQGNLFIVDTQANVVRVIASGKGPIPALPSVASPAAGNVYTVAGNGNNVPSSAPLCAQDQPSTGDGNYYGNGCPATEAVLSMNTYSTPLQGGVAIDAHGNVYISDSVHEQVRVVYAGGTVPGLPSNPTPGNIYAFAGTAGSFGYSGDGLAATTAQLSIFGGVAVDPSGNVYIADSGNGVVRVVYGGVSVPPGLPSTTAAGTINTLPAGPPPTWIHPVSVASDVSGNIYVSDNGAVYAYYVVGTVPGVSNPVPGNVYLFAGGVSGTFGPYGGPATAVVINYPAQIAFDFSGNVYVTDYNSYLYNQTVGYIDKIDPTGTITLLAGNENGTNCATAIDAYGDGCPASMAAPPGPTGIAVTPDGTIYYTDSVLLHAINESQTNLWFNSSVVGLASRTLVAQISNTGSQTLQITGIQVTGPFAQVPTGGGADCSASTSLAPGDTCQLGMNFTPPAVGPSSGSLVIASNSTNATGGNNTYTLLGTGSMASSSTALVVSPVLANPGQPVALTATITPPFGDTVAPTGTVNFFNGSTSLGTAAVSQNAATLSVTTLPAGTYSLTASYSGDSNYSSSSSLPVALVISSKPVPVVSLTTSASNITVGQSVTFTATVAPYSGTTLPTGSVTFTDGLNALGSAVPLDGSGAATFSTSALPAGASTIYAVYSGDSNYTAATSPGSSLQVQANALLTLNPGVISTIAGTFGVTGFGGDGGPATSTSTLLYQPKGVSVDPAGNVYIADSTNHRIRVIASGSGVIPGISNPVAGTIYTVVGNDNSCNPDSNGILNCGDGGPAASATLNSPSGVWADGFGNLYIGDNAQGGLVRKVNASGVISTVAGDVNTNDTPANFGDGGAATSATLSSAYSIRTDNSGNLYIADTGHQLIRRVDAETGIITTVAGSQSLGGGYGGDGGLATSAQLYFPNDVALDPAGNLFIADSGNQVIRRVDAKTGEITTVAGVKSGSGGGYGGDGGPATSATLNNPSGVYVDLGGNLYIADTYNDVIRRVDSQTGIITTVAGVPGTTGTSGDGGLATNANLSTPQSIAADSFGNLYIADTGDSVIREVTGGSSTVGFGSQGLGSTTTQTFTVSSTGGQPLSLTAISFPDGFNQQSSGGTDCAAPMTLNPGQSCQLAIGFFPTSATSVNGSVTIASNSSNATSGQNSIAVSGVGVPNSGTTAQSISFTAPATATYGQQINLTATATSGLPVTFLVKGPGRLAGNTLTVTGVGAITVTAYQFGDNSDAGNPSGWAAATPVPATIDAQPVQLTVTADSFSQAPGQPIPTLTYKITGLVNGDTQATATTGAPALSTTATQSSPTGSYPITIQQGTLQTTTPNYTLTAASFVSGTFNITAGLSQTITFPAIPNSNSLVYGASPITLQATTSAPGLQVIYTVQGPASVTGSVLSITGAGPVAVTATQPGNATYGPAQPVTQSFTVAAAPLTFTANNLTMAQGASVPQLTYTVSGLVNGDTAASVISGAPALSTTADSSSPLGTVAPITIKQGTLAVSSNYSITPSSFVNGTLTVVQGVSQSINFGALPNTVYGVAPFTLNATASSSLPVTFSVIGPATLANNLLTVTGAGTVTVTATQSGSATYSAATPVQQSFTVAPAPLSVIADDATRANNMPNPTFTYHFSGFVNGDKPGVVGGAPAFTTTATPGSPVGTYPIVPSAGTLTAANYTFNFVPGTLTITTGGPAPDFSMTLGPQQVTIVAGQIQQTTVTVSSVNYYQGLLNLSCKSLPANVSCVFTPASLSVAPYTSPGVNGPVPIQGTLTINTSSAPVVSSLARPGGGIRSATMAGWASLLFGLIIAWRRKRLAQFTSVWTIAMAAVLFGATLSLTACGGSSHSSSTGNGLAAPGTTTIQVVATDSNGGPAHSVNLELTVR